MGGGYGTYGKKGLLEPAVVVLGEDGSRLKIVYIDTPVLVWFGFGDDGFRHRNGSIALSLNFTSSVSPSLSRMGSSALGQHAKAVEAS